MYFYSFFFFFFKKNDKRKAGGEYNVYIVDIIIDLYELLSYGY